MDSFMDGMVWATLVMLVVPVTVGLTILVWYWRSRGAGSSGDRGVRPG